MLASFQIRRNFNKLAISMHVDCGRRDAEIIVLYDRRIVRIEPVRFDLVETPEHCERWLSEPQGEYGSRIETLEWNCRKGILQ